MDDTLTRRLVAFARSLLALGALAVGVPYALVRGATARFGGPAPWSAMPPPSAWEWARIEAALTDRMSESTITDIVVRAGLAVAWVAVAVFVVTVAAELSHMVRHRGLPLPAVRGLGVSQGAARAVAAGLLVLLPNLVAPARADARSGLLVPEPRVGAVFVVDVPRSPVVAESAPVAGDSGSADYVVRPGDSVYAIAERAVGPDGDPAAYAERLLDLNLGRRMPDGQVFTNAALINVGWTLTLPDGGRFAAPTDQPAAPAPVVNPAAGSHVVAPGETLWSIAELELGDPHRWHELFDANAGRTFADGRTLDDPNDIHPGWELAMPGTAAVAPEPVSDTAGATEATAPAVTVPVAESPPDASPATTPAPASPADGAATTPAASSPVATAPAVGATAESTPDPGATAGPPPDARPASAPAAASPADRAATPPPVASTDAESTTAPGATAEPHGDAPSASMPVASPADVGATTPPRGAPPADNPATASPADRAATPPPPASPPVAPAPVVGATSAESTTAPGAAAPAPTGEPVNRWIDAEASPRPAPLAPTTPPELTDPADRAPAPGESAELVTLPRAVMLAGGVLLLLGVRRRRQLRTAAPRTNLPAPPQQAISLERELRAIDSAERLARVDLAVRAAALPLIAGGERVLAVVASPDGELELIATGPVELGEPWRGGEARWTLPATVPIDDLAPDARRVGAPTPALVHLGCDGDRDVYVDLEAVEALEIAGPPAQAEAIVAAVSMTLATSVLAEVATLVGVGVPATALCDHPNAALAPDVPSGLQRAAEAIGSTAVAPGSTFELRARGTGGEAWEPAVLLVGTASGTVVPPAARRGLAIVSAAPILGPSSVLAPDGDTWVLRPAGLRFAPLGVTPDELAAVGELLDVGVPVPDEPPAGADRDETLVDPDLTEWEHELAADAAPSALVAPARIAVNVPPLRYELLVRLLGPVRVESADGRQAEFQRSKARELVAWLATHRERASRTLARTALWDVDVQDATFSNVASDARKGLARLVAPPAGEDWIGRGHADDRIPLHPLVRTDAEVVADALSAARLQPPDAAIATLTPAVGLLAGMPFEGTSYSWADPEGITSSFVLLAVSAASELAAHCLSVGDIDGLFAATERGLRVLSGHEELIALRMRAHAQAGDYAGVRHEWESYARSIAADPWNDGEPSPKLVALRAELLGPAPAPE